MNEQDFQTHVKVLGWLHIGVNLFLVAMGAIALLLLAGIGFATGDAVASRVLAIVGTVGAAFFFVLAVPGFVAGYGLLTHRSWGRILALVVGILNLLNFPIGTAIGVYTFWVLLQQGAEEYFASPKLA